VLTVAQRQVIEALIAGRTIQSVARDFGITIFTVQGLIRRARKRMGANTTYQLIALFVKTYPDRTVQTEPAAAK
jgi:DNA-binding CsgD family transcriptional regulator